MRQSKYLNVILTVNAGLLAGLLWTQVAGHAPLSAEAHAQSSGTGFVNAAEQRQRMIETLQEIKGSVEATRKVVESGKMKVEVANIDKLKGEPGTTSR
jgi:hypothetical protein